MVFATCRDHQDQGTQLNSARTCTPLARRCSLLAVRCCCLHSPCQVFSCIDSLADGDALCTQGWSSIGSLIQSQSLADAVCKDRSNRAQLSCSLVGLAWGSGRFAQEVESEINYKCSDTEIDDQADRRWQRAEHQAALQVVDEYKVLPMHGGPIRLVEAKFCPQCRSSTGLL